MSSAGKQRTRRTIPGLEPRLEAIARLRDVLAGAPFAPIDAATIADPRDRALANRIVTAALRHHGHIAAILAETLPRGLPKRSGLFEAALHCGIAQLLYLDDIPDHSALDLSVEATKTDSRALPFAKLANGVLRTVQRERDRFLALDPALLFPPWLRDRWAGTYGEDALSAFADALRETPPLDLTLAPTAPPGATEALGALPVLGNTVRVVTRTTTIADLTGFADGSFWVQDAAAAIPARLLPARPGARILDICAAPGGKTAQLAAAGAAVTALDIDEHRMGRVRENLERLHLSADLVVGDALEHQPAALYDAILLDAPCSATGTFRRHPEVLFSRTADGIAGRAALQRTMIAKAASLLAPDGTLVYCVCSLEADEGEEQARWVASQTDLKLEPSAIRPVELDGWAAALTPEGWLRTHPGLPVPGMAGGTLDGFFAARWTKQL